MERGKELDFGNKALVLQNDQSGTVEWSQELLLRNKELVLQNDQVVGTVELGATTAEQGACSCEQRASSTG